VSLKRISNMLRVVFLVLLSGLAGITSFAAEKAYAVANIDTGLLRHANAVIRNYELEVKIVAKDEVWIKEHYILTILNDKAAKLGRFKTNYSSLNKLMKVSGTVYDKDGKEIQKIREDDFISWPATLMQGFYDDERVKMYGYATGKYPYTVEFTSVSKILHTFSQPDFVPQPAHDCAVEKASFTLIVPVGIKVNYRQVHIDNDQETVEEGNKIHTWQVKDLPAYELEQLDARDGEHQCAVLISCNDFSLGKYNGNASDWSSYGRFMYELNLGRDSLPAEIKQDIKGIAAKAKSKHQAIQMVYKYLQENNRYVAIEYGIGGWQTLEASFLARNKYGDCKALSNYMMALLREAGITSYPVLILAGSSRPHAILRDFPVNQFNHEILCVPDGKDTLWLECTSNDLPVNFLSSFTEGRYGLMITPAGGKIINTPVADTATNKVSRNIIATLTGNDLAVSMKNRYSNEPALAVYHKINNKSKAQQDAYINTAFDLASYTVSSYSFERADTGFFMIMNERVELLAKNMHTASGTYHFINCNLAPYKFPEYYQVESRRTPFRIQGTHSIHDTLSIQLPAGSTANIPFSDTVVAHSFGSFRLSIKQLGDKVLLIRRFSQHEGIYAPALFNTYVGWLQQVEKLCNRKLAFTTK
jgi:hypothetical protein